MIALLLIGGVHGGAAAATEPFPASSIAVAAGGAVTIYSEAGARIGRLKLPLLTRVDVVAHSPHRLFAAGWPYLLLYTGIGDQSDPVRVGEELSALAGIVDTPELVTAIAPVQGGDVYVAFSDGQLLHEIVRYTRHELPGTAGFTQERQGILVPERVTAMDVDAGGCLLAYGTTNGLLRFLDACSRMQLAPQRVTTPLTILRIAPEQTLLTASSTGPIRRIGVDGKVRRTFDVPGVARWTALDLTADGSGFWAADDAGVLYRFDLATGGVTARFETGSRVSALAVVGTRRQDLPAQGTPPPQRLALDGVATLTGEGFAGLAVAPAAPPGSCARGADSLLPISSSGETIGPYGGLFKVTLTATVGPQTLPGTSSFPLGLPSGPVKSLEGTFSVSSSSGSVQGSLALAGAEPPSTGICAEYTNEAFPNSPIGVEPLTGFFRNLQAPRLAYEARIESSGRTYSDTGAAAVYFTEYNHRAQSGVNRGQQHVFRASFVSSQLAVEERFARGAQGSGHTASIPAATSTLQLTVRWRRARDRFSLTNVRLVPARRSLTLAGKLRPGGIDVQVRRTRTGLDARITKLRPGRLVFTLKPLRLQGAATVRTAVVAQAPS